MNDIGAAGDDVFEIRMGEDHAMAGFAGEIDGVDAFADAEEGEDVVEDAVAIVGESAGEMESDVEGDSLDAEAGERAAEDGGFFEEEDAFAGLGEDSGGGEAGDSATDDDGVVGFHERENPLPDPPPEYRGRGKARGAAKRGVWCGGRDMFFRLLVHR